MKLLGILLLGLSCLAIAAAPKDTTALDSLHGNLVLRATQSPYLVKHSLVQREQDSLRIEPGVQILVGSYAKITLHGYVRIEGTTRKPVRIEAIDSSSDWIGLSLATGEHVALIQGLIVRQAFRNAFSGVQGAILQSRFEDNYYGAWVEDSPSLSFANCTWGGNRYGLSIMDDSLNVSASTLQGNVVGLWLEGSSGLRGTKNRIEKNQQADTSGPQDPKRNTASGHYPLKALQAAEAGF